CHSFSHWISIPFNNRICCRFDDVNNSYHQAKHSRYDEMYHPHLGTFRERKMFTTLAPSLCIPRRNRSCSYEFVPHKAYAPKQGEWLVERDRKWVSFVSGCRAVLTSLSLWPLYIFGTPILRHPFMCHLTAVKG
ncbi:unnamed protein product, partial [Heligmosomoides polygyrus]|uniref:Testis expressed 36 n=1 Tax=Heligmosomoides polygyrus TaxID=6339 RepID=A0A183G563_HELPZ